MPRRCPPEALAGAGGVTLHGYLGTASPTQEIQVLESRLSLSIWESHWPSLCCSLLQGLGVGGRQWGAALPRYTEQGCLWVAKPQDKPSLSPLHMPPLTSAPILTPDPKPFLRVKKGADFREAKGLVLSWKGQEEKTQGIKEK